MHCSAVLWDPIYSRSSLQLMLAVIVSPVVSMTDIVNMSLTSNFSKTIMPYGIRLLS
jgi:hypothetical protein